MRAVRVFAFLMELAKFLLLASSCLLLLPRSQSPLAASLGFFFVLAASALFFLRAAWLGRQLTDHAFCAAHFDQGLGLFLAAFFVAALLKARIAFAEGLALPYLLFGILALGSAKKAEAGGFGRPSRPSSLAATATAFILAAAAFAALAPALLGPARRAAGSLKAASLEALRLFGLLLQRLLGAPPSLAAGSPSEGGGLLLPPGAEEAGRASQAVAQVLLWTVLASVGALLAALAFLGLRRLARGLGARGASPVGGPSLAARLRGLLAALLGRAFSLLRRARARALSRASLSEAQRSYARFLACGRRAGAGPKVGETPREYGRRLARLFPESAARAGFVVEALEREVYGGRRPEAAALEELASIRRRTRLLSFLAEGARRGLRSRGKRGADPARRRDSAVSA